MARFSCSLKTLFWFSVTEEDSHRQILQFLEEDQILGSSGPQLQERTPLVTPCPRRRPKLKGFFRSPAQGKDSHGQVLHFLGDCPHYKGSLGPQLQERTPLVTPCPRRWPMPIGFFRPPAPGKTHMARFSCSLSRNLFWFSVTEEDSRRQVLQFLEKGQI
jgi:hypothetical protein